MQPQWTSWAALVLSATIGAQEAFSGKIETKHVQVIASASDTTLVPGGKLSLYVYVAPKPTMHVYAPGQKEYIPVSLMLDPNPAVKASPPRFPKAEQFLFKALNETQLVYSKPFRIVQDIVVGRSVTRGRVPLTLKATLRYQACDDAICYLPVNVPLTWTIAAK